MLTFEELPDYLPKQLCCFISFLTSNACGFQFCHIINACLLFKLQPSQWFVIVLLIRIFLMISVLVGHLCIFFAEMSIEIPCPYKKTRLSFYWLSCLYINLDIRFISDTWFVNIFFLYYTKVLNFDEAQFICFCSFVACAAGIISNHCLIPSTKDLYLYFLL